MNEELIKDATERAFNVTPDTVYGLLVGLLVLAVLGMAYLMVRYQNKLVEMNVSNIEVLKDLNTSLLLLKEDGVQLSTDLKEQFDRSREHIENLIQRIDR